MGRELLGIGGSFCRLKKEEVLKVAFFCCCWFRCSWWAGSLKGTLRNCRRWFWTGFQWDGRGRIFAADSGKRRVSVLKNWRWRKKKTAKVVEVEGNSWGSSEAFLRRVRAMTIHRWDDRLRAAAASKKHWRSLSQCSIGVSVSAICRKRPGKQRVCHGGNCAGRGISGLGFEDSGQFFRGSLGSACSQNAVYGAHTRRLDTNGWNQWSEFRIGQLNLANWMQNWAKKSMHKPWHETCGRNFMDGRFKPGIRILRPFYLCLGQLG